MKIKKQTKVMTVPQNTVVETENMKIPGIQVNGVCSISKYLFNNFQFLCRGKYCSKNTGNKLNVSYVFFFES